MKIKTAPTLIAAALFAIAGHASAADWFVRAGVHTVNPKSDNGTLAGGALQADIGSDTKPTLAFGKWLNDSWAVEVLAAAPFSHEVRLNGAKALDFKHLPPTVSLQYYFAPGAKFRPFVSAGINYTWTYGEDEKGPLAGTKVRIDNSWGLAAQVGFLARVNDSWSIVADARWMDIDADVSVNGSNVGAVHVDPLVYGVYLNYDF